MNCWKSVNITKELGVSRIYMMSLLLGLMSFIILYLPISMYHHSHSVKDYGILPLFFVLFFLPTIHKLMHIIPLLLMYKRVRIEWRLVKGIMPTFSYRTMSVLSKRTSILMAIAPTVFLTIPAIISSGVFPSFFTYFLIFSAVNIGLSFTDFLYVNQFLKAPRKCIIENAREGFDILIKRYQD